MRSSRLIPIIPHDKVLKKIAASLKPQGQFVLLFPSAGTPFHPIGSASKASAASSKWRSHFENALDGSYSFRKESYIRWALEAGFHRFTIEEIQPILITTPETGHRWPLGVWRALRSVWR